MFISQQSSLWFEHSLYGFVYKKAQFPSKFQNFPPNANISRQGASQIAYFFPLWVLETLMDELKEFKRDVIGLADRESRSYREYGCTIMEKQKKTKMPKEVDFWYIQK